MNLSRVLDILLLKRVEHSSTLIDLNGIINPSHGLINYRCRIMMISHGMVRRGDGVWCWRQRQRIGRVMIILSKNWFGLMYNVRLFDDRHVRRRNMNFGQNNRRHNAVRGRTKCSCKRENAENL